MRHNWVQRLLLPVLLGAALALPLASTALAASRVVFQASKEDVKSACDGIKGDAGVETHGEGGKGYGCYNPNNGVLVACASNGACTGYIPRGAPKKKALPNVLYFGLGITPADAAGGGDNGGGNKGGGSGGTDGGVCGGPDGCIQ